MKHPLMGIYPKKHSQDPGNSKVGWKSKYGRLLYLVTEYGSLPSCERMMPKIVLFVLLLPEFGYFKLSTYETRLAESNGVHCM